LKFNERKPIFDKALQDKNLIFVDIKNEKLPNSTYELLDFFKFDETYFYLYFKRGFSFKDIIMYPQKV
jgi:hypothetical protein